ncbi:hypothetical protein F2Q69_00061294 [Brassica cretica]|uniref:Uncharacterized protein n=1 Tax=Brassica cretica TaxID=69181 RepID=A0A8S9RKK8_BRACR|nr:hypothetical protein F2Q69_00061294 [Brassica cretica]
MAVTKMIFNQMVLIFILDMFFRSGADFGRFMGSLLGSLLKYNALEDFQEIFHKTSWKSSSALYFRRLARRLLINLPNRPVFSLPEDLQLSRPEGRPVSRPVFSLPEDLQLSRPEGRPVSRPVFSLPEDLQLSRPEGRPVSRPGFFLPEDLQEALEIYPPPSYPSYSSRWP